MKVHVFDTDPRKLTDPLYHTNCGSFSIVANGFNSGLKKIGSYAEPDNADFVGICDALNMGFHYRNKSSFIINVWDTINVLPNQLIEMQRYYWPKVFGLSDQITQLWRANGVECETTMPGCNVNFWRPSGLEKKSTETIFLFNSFANVRSGLDLAVEAFSKAFTKKDNVVLVIKNTDSNEALEKYLHESLKNCNFRYIIGRSSFADMRELYRVSNYSLNVMRMSSWGLGIHEAIACGCIPIVGNFNPSNTIVEGLSAFSIDPIGKIKINDKVPQLVAKGLRNAYGNFEYSEPPLFYDYSIDQYAELLRHLHETRVECSVELERKKLADRWSWETAAENLVKALSC